MAQSTRRSLLGTALAAAGTVAAVAPALAVEPGADVELLSLAAEHLQLAREYKESVFIASDLNMADLQCAAQNKVSSALFKRSREIEDLASECTARTVAGIRAQLAIAMRSLTADSDGDEPVDLPPNTESVWNLLTAMVEGLDAGVTV